MIQRLSKKYDIHEARAIFYRLMEDKYGLSRTDVCLGAIDNLTAEQKKELEDDIKRLEEGEPVQYVTGFEYFHGLRFNVCQGVLIPRPETEELVDWIIADIQEPTSSSPLSILDIGSGSGAINISLAKVLGQRATLTAWDVSDAALSVTANNAILNDVHINIEKQDALNAPTTDEGKWDIVVSNPPYICHSEKSEMASNVLDYEPSLALFVPDQDPLLFYRKIAQYAQHSLKADGRLYYEINERFAKETTQMLSTLGYTHIEIRQDQFGKDRMIQARI